MATVVSPDVDNDILQLRTQLTVARNEIHNLRCEV
jgi:hypothetical protein